MKRISRSSFIILLVVILLFTLGCSIIPDTLDKLKEANPFSKLVATATATPRPVATPRSPIAFESCSYLMLCPPVDDILGYASDDVKTHSVKIPADQTVNLSMDWTVLDAETLEATLPDVKWVFTIDGQDYFRDDLVVHKDTIIDDVAYPAAWLSVNLSGWKVGESHIVKIGLTLEKKLSDGWVDLPAGHTYVKTYNFIPIYPPTAMPTATFKPMNTATPKPTVAPTKKPVSTKAPAVPTATKAAVQPTTPPATNLAYDMTLKVENKCGEQHLVVFTGPIRLKYTVPPGQTVEYQAPQGTYTWLVDNTYAGGPQDLNINVWTLTLCR